MNEQIKKLTIQALAKCDATKMTQLSSSVDNGNGVDIPLEFSEKFAELIVRECAGIYSKIDNGNPHLGADDYLEALQKHFGIE